MAYPTFLFMNPASVVYVGCGSGFSNLNDYDPVTSWSNETTAEWNHVTLDFGSSKPITHVALANHNLATVGGDVILFASNTTSSGDFVTVRGPVNCFPFTLTDPVIIPLDQNTGSYRYVRLNIYNGTGSIAEPLHVGSYWAGNALVMDSPFDVPARFENPEYQTFEGVSLNGNLRSSQIYSGGRIIDEVRFSIQSDATANLIRSFVQSVKGRRYPFYFAEDTSTTGSVRLMHFAEDYVPVETIGYNLNAVSIKMRTHTSEF